MAPPVVGVPAPPDLALKMYDARRASAVVYTSFDQLVFASRRASNAALLCHNCSTSLALVDSVSSTCALEKSSPQSASAPRRENKKLFALTIAAGIAPKRARYACNARETS